MFYDICIIGGAGRVGLPLGVSFANKNFKTILFDINKEALDKIQNGSFPFREKDAEIYLNNALESKNLFFSNSPEVISNSKNIIIIIGTPIDQHLNPSFDSFLRIIRDYSKYFVDDQILILRSTIYPGVSEKIKNFFDRMKKKVNVAFCPERIVEGMAFDEIANLPQIISAFDDDTLNKVEALFKKITTKEIVKLNPIEAELAKLFSNAWRYIKFAVANQFFMIAEDYDLDYLKIDKAMKAGYKRNEDLPSPGFAAGPCLFKDTMQLAAFHRNNFFLGHAAMLLNEGLPNFIIHKLKRKLNLQDKVIGILGMSFKADCDDIRDSLSVKLKKIAEIESKEVLCHDFYIKSNEPSFISLEELLERADILILATPHKEYKKINLSEHKNKIIIDIWGFFQND